MKLLLLLFVAFPCSALAWLAPDIESSAKAAEDLEEFRSGGEFGALYATEDGGNVAVGVGVAEVVGNDFERGRKLALANATARLTEILNGSALSTRVEVRTTSDEEHTSALTKKEVAGKTGKIRIRGYWTQGNSIVVVACRYIDTTPLATEDDFSAEAGNITLAKEWTDALSRCREIWLGGVCPLYNAREGKFYLGAIVSVGPKASPVAAENLWRNAATRDLGKYSSGAEFKEDLQLAQESIVRGNAADEHEELDVRTRERTKTAVGPMKKAGTFTLKLTGRRYALFVAEVSEN